VPVKVTRRPPTLLPVRFRRGRLDSLATKGLAAYLITSLSATSDPDQACELWVSRFLGPESQGLHPRPSVSRPFRD
jgi:hypothetical protein